MTTISERVSVMCGRCRSGKRWFWCAEVWYGTEPCDCGRDGCQPGAGPHAHGWEDTEAAAVEAMSDACVRLGGDHPSVNQSRDAWRERHTYQQAGTASRTLRRINAAKRAAKPPTGDTGARHVEYLYGEHSWFSDYDNERCCEVVPFQITKKTARRIYYLRLDSLERSNGGARPGQPLDIGYINRQEFETACGDGYRKTAPGEIYTGRRAYEDDWHLFATHEAAEAYLYRYERERQREAEESGPKLKALKAAMADAHPDRGGTDAAFIAARKEYQQAIRLADAG